MKKLMQCLVFVTVALVGFGVSLQGQQVTSATPAQLGVSNLAEVPQSNFIGFPLVGKWYPYGGEYSGATVAKQGNLCFVQGLIRSGDWAGQLLSLPEGYRPQKTLIFGLNNHVNSCRVNLWTTGGAAWAAGTKDQSWVSLCGMIYSPTQAGTRIQLNNAAWEGYSVKSPTAGYATPAWIKEGNIVVLTGLARLTSSWAAVNPGNPHDERSLGGRLIGQLPEGARPVKRLIFNCDNHGHANRVDVLPSGSIILTSDGSGETWMSLNNIAFSTVEGTPLQLFNNWTVYDPYWGVPSAIKHGNVCMLQGLIKPPNNKPVEWTKIAQLPKELWPARRLIFNGMGAQKTARIDVTADGSVYWGVGNPSSDWVSLSSVVYAVPAQQFGGKNYIHVERPASYRAYHENWKFGMPGQGWVKFKARTVQDITLSFSSVPNDLPGASYFITFGGYDNTRTFIRKGWSDTNLYEINTLTGGNPNAIVTGGRPGNGQTWDDYWIKIDNGLITLGKGAAVGQNEIGRWQDPSPLKFVQYIGFGGWDFAVEYKDIQISGMPIVPLVINLPEGFEPEEGKVKRITVGSRNGELEAWAVGFDEQLWRYDTYSMAANPWIKQEFKDAAGAVMKFEDISCSSEGTLVAIDTHGKALRYDWNNKKWDLIDAGKGNEALDLEFISAGNKECIWSVDTDDKDIYELTKEGWKVRADGVGLYVAAGVDGTVVALNTESKPYRYHDGKWFEMGDVKLERIAVGDRHNIIGSTDKDNMLWQWKHPEWKHPEGKDAKPAHEKGADHVYAGPHGKWEPVLGKDGKQATGLDEIAINAAGTIFGADEDGDPYHKGEAGVHVTVPAPAVVAAQVVAVTAAPTAQIIKQPEKLTQLLAAAPAAGVAAHQIPTPAEIDLVTKATAAAPAPADVVAKVTKAVEQVKASSTKPAVQEQLKAETKKTLTKAAATKPTKVTRGAAKKTGKLAKKPVKAKTSGKGKALKRVAKVKKATKKAAKIIKKAQKKADKKKKAAKKAAKKPAKKAAKKPAKKPAKK